MWSAWSIALTLNYVLALLVVGAVLRQRKDPMAMLAWILAIVGIPFVGTGLYWLLGSTRVGRRARRKRKRLRALIARLNHRTANRVGPQTEVTDADLPDDLAGIARLGRRLCGMPPTYHNEVEIYEEANETYAALEAAFRSAEHHIHVEYYIWQPDETGRHFRDILIERAQAGVECRVLLDAVGSWRLGQSFLRPWQKAGVQVGFFLPLYPLRKRFSPHLRNHRKIAIVDGKTGFMGSQNIGDEYRGRLKRLSPWYDSHMRIRGPAVLFLQQTFAEDWSFATRLQLDSEEYFCEPARGGNSIVQILPTGPDQNVRALEQMLFGAVAGAERSIRIATPYFVPDPGLQSAMLHASYRGVRVELVLPTRSDNPFVLWAGRSFYRELLEGGVEIHEYDDGVLHSKVVTVDDRWCMIGSANMDVRSFRLNFEMTAMLYDADMASHLSQSIGRFCEGGRDITLRDVWQRTLRQQLVEGTARLFAPLL